MYLIHKPFFNQLVRKAAHPLRKLIPSKFHFAIDGTISIDLGDGKQMRLSGNPTSNLLRVLFWHGIEGFEYDEYKVFKVLVSRVSTFLDIGSNLGYYSIVGKKFNPNLNVTAFEPLPAAYKFLKQNILLNNLDITAVPIALSNENGTATFHIRHNSKFNNFEDQLPGDSSLNSSMSQTSNWSKIIVNTQTLDSFFQSSLDKQKTIDFIKIDTEAAEHLTLKGATLILKNHRPIIMIELIKGKIESEIDAIFSDLRYGYYKTTSKGLLKMYNLNLEKAKEDYFFIPIEKESILKDFII
jgi:FkbM family methyltransferase